MDNEAAGTPVNLSFVVRNDEKSNIQITAYTGGHNSLTVTPAESWPNPGDMTIFRVTGETKPGDSISVVLMAIPFNSTNIQELEGKTFQVSIQVK
jgi:hypothetical protein